MTRLVRHQDRASLNESAVWCCSMNPAVVSIEVGTPAGNAVLLTDCNVDERIADLRWRIGQLERLRGTAVILDGNTVLSVYRPRRTKARRLLRHRRGRGLGVPRYRDAVKTLDIDEA